MSWHLFVAFGWCQIIFQKNCHWFTRKIYSLSISNYTSGPALHIPICDWRIYSLRWRNFPICSRKRCGFFCQQHPLALIEASYWQLHEPLVFILQDFFQIFCNAVNFQLNSMNSTCHSERQIHLKCVVWPLHVFFFFSFCCCWFSAPQAKKH